MNDSTLKPDSRGIAGRKRAPRKPRMSLADQAYERLEEAIVTLQLAPGSLISEPELVEMMGIGRTPVREAVQRLARDRLIQVLPKRGLLVSPLDLVGQINLLELRREVEGLIVRSAAQRSSPQQRENFARLSKLFKDAAERNDDIAFARFDKEFNELCMVAAQNQYAQDAMRLVSGLSRRSWYFHQQRGAPLPKMALLHAEMAAALAVRDEERALDALDRLLRTVEFFAKAALSTQY